MSSATPDGGRKDPHKHGKVGAIMRRSIDGVRQWMHPGPFRIDESPDLVVISKDVLLGQEAAPSPRPTGGNVDVDFKRVLQTLAAVATALWRVRTKLGTESSAKLPSELRHLPRHVEAAWDAMASGGFEIQDPRGQRYVPGMAVNPVTYSPEPSIPPNTIVETLKPTVFWKDILIQRADVILASPADGSASHPGSVEPSPTSADPSPDPRDVEAEAPMQAPSQEETTE
jgi:hypothetical protein